LIEALLRKLDRIPLGLIIRRSEWCEVRGEKRGF